MGAARRGYSVQDAPEAQRGRVSRHVSEKNSDSVEDWIVIFILECVSKAGDAQSQGNPTAFQGDFPFAGQRLR